MSLGMSKKIFLFFLVILGAIWLWVALEEDKGPVGGDIIESRAMEDLPWQIDASDIAITRVFSTQVGRDTLSMLVKRLQKVPEIALFEGKAGDRLIEAYFPRVAPGVLQGAMAAEMDMQGVDLSGFARLEKKGKPMPSGRWKFTLSKTGIMKANTSRIWKLVYFPQADYSAEQLVRFFGEPQYKKPFNESVVNWYYPEKGLLITHDREGRESFYYVAQAEYEKLTRGVEKEMTEMSGQQ